jgi:hypothetical protein
VDLPTPLYAVTDDKLVFISNAKKSAHGSKVNVLHNKKQME